MEGSRGLPGGGVGEGGDVGDFKDVSVVAGSDINKIALLAGEILLRTRQRP